MTEKEISYYIDEIKHTMDCEGLPLTEQDITNVEDILRGKKTGQEVKDAILKKYGLQRL